MTDMNDMTDQALLAIRHIESALEEAGHERIDGQTSDDQMAFVFDMIADAMIWLDVMGEDVNERISEALAVFDSERLP